MGKKAKLYVVWKGKHPGIFESWADCKAQIEGFKGAEYKSFATFAEAKKAYNSNYLEYKGKSKGKPGLTQEELLKIGEPNYNSIAVDAASSGNPGRMEYRGVDTKSKKVLFHQGPFEQGTNNVGEFLALVHGLAFLKQKKALEEGFHQVLYRRIKHAYDELIPYLTNLIRIQPMYLALEQE